jgi:hypothetical protein
VGGWLFGLGSPSAAAIAARRADLQAFLGRLAECCLLVVSSPITAAFFETERHVRRASPGAAGSTGGARIGEGGRSRAASHASGQHSPQRQQQQQQQLQQKKKHQGLGRRFTSFLAGGGGDAQQERANDVMSAALSEHTRRFQVDETMVPQKPRRMSRRSRSDAT